MNAGDHAHPRGTWPADEGKAPLGNVIMFSAEDDPEDTIVPRLLAAGADVSRVRIVEAAKDANGERLFDLQHDLNALEREIERFGNVNLVTFDPISSYLGSKIDGNSNNDVATRPGASKPNCRSPSGSDCLIDA